MVASPELTSSQRPIGLFDSGLGGLTVLRAVRRELPNESLVFLGDTARVPYGTRSPSTVIRYAESCAKRLMEYDVKFVVVACNTVSAVALPALREALSVPVLGVIGPGARSGVEASRAGRIGVIATNSTIASGAYVREIEALNPSAKVFANGAPLLVPLVEEGWVDGEVPRLAIERYLRPLLQERIDALVLGCTHYPLLRSVIEQVLKELSPVPVVVVDGARATALELADALARFNLRRSGPAAADPVRLLVTDMPSGFSNVASRFLSDSVAGVHVEQIDITVGRESPVG